MERPIFEAILDEENLSNGIFAISLVEFPAIESEFIALSKQESEPILMATIDEEKRIVMGAVLIPNRPVLQRINGKELYLYFSKETVQRSAELFFKRGFQSNATLEHESPLKGLTVFESWMVADTQKDKSAFYNMSVPVATWMASMKVENDEVWNDYVKTGKVKGFSIEGYFTPKEVIMSKVKEEEMTDEQKLEKIKQLIF